MRMPKSAVSAAYCSGFSSRACTTWYPYARTFATVVATRRKSAPECSRMRSSTARSMSAAALVLLRRLLHWCPLEEVVDEVVELARGVALDVGLVGIVSERAHDGEVV